MARVVVFGATGKCGSAIVTETLASGHSVVGYSRRPLNRSAAGLTSIEAALDNESALVTAMQGAQCIISALGHDDGEHDTLARWAERTLPLAKAAGVRQVILIGGRRLLPDYPDGPHRSEKLRIVAEDQLAVADIITSSGLDYLILCPPRIHPTPADGNYRTSQDAYFESPMDRVSSGNIGHHVARILEAAEHWNHLVAIENLEARF